LLRRIFLTIIFEIFLRREIFLFYLHTSLSQTPTLMRIAAPMKLRSNRTIWIKNTKAPYTSFPIPLAVKINQEHAPPR